MLICERDFKVLLPHIAFFHSGLAGREFAGQGHFGAEASCRSDEIGQWLFYAFSSAPLPRARLAESVPEVRDAVVGVLRISVLWASWLGQGRSWDGCGKWLWSWKES